MFYVTCDRSLTETLQLQDPVTEKCGLDLQLVSGSLVSFLESNCPRIGAADLSLLKIFIRQKKLAAEILNYWHGKFETYCSP